MVGELPTNGGGKGGSPSGQGGGGGGGGEGDSANEGVTDGPAQAAAFGAPSVPVGAASGVGSWANCRRTARNSASVATKAAATSGSKCRPASFRMIPLADSW